MNFSASYFLLCIFRWRIIQRVCVVSAATAATADSAESRCQSTTIDTDVWHAAHNRSDWWEANRRADSTVTASAATAEDSGEGSNELRQRAAHLGGKSARAEGTETGDHDQPCESTRQTRETGHTNSVSGV